MSRDPVEQLKGGPYYEADLLLLLLILLLLQHKSLEHRNEFVTYWSL